MFPVVVVGLSGRGTGCFDGDESVTSSEYATIREVSGDSRWALVWCGPAGRSLSGAANAPFNVAVGSPVINPTADGVGVMGGGVEMGIFFRLRLGVDGTSGTAN